MVFSNGVEVISGSSPESPVEVCSLKQFLKYCKNGACDAWLCLMRSKNVSGNLSGLSASLANASSEYSELERRILAICNQEFADVFAEPGMPPERLFDHKIVLRDPNAPPPRLR